jgi:hypothetical protein
MATTTSTVVVTERVCDYCDKPEAEVGFIQTYLMVPRRSYGKAGALFPKGARDIDLCAGCALLLAPRPHVNVAPPRPKFCRAKKDGVRCMLEAGHKSEHVTATAQHWGWLVLAA